MCAVIGSEGAKVILYFEEDDEDYLQQRWNMRLNI